MAEKEDAEKEQRLRKERELGGVKHLMAEIAFEILPALSRQFGLTMSTQAALGTVRRAQSVSSCHRQRGGRDSHMTHRLGWMAWATGAMVLAAASGCGGNSADPPPTTAATTSAPTEPPTSISPMSPSAQASSDVIAEVTKYYSVLDELGGDPTSSLSKLNTVATSTQLSAMRAVLRQQHQRHERQTGSLVIADTKVQSVSLANSNPSAGKVPAVVVDVCWDVSKVDILDAAGKSVISPDRPDRGWTRLTVANYKYASNPDHGWRVASGQDLKQAPCAAS